jgi:hypothetical protein
MRTLFSSVLLVKASERDDARAGVVAEAERGGYRLVHLAELRERYEKDPESLLLVDTREEWEFRAGRIRSARLFSMKPTWWARLRSAGKLKRFLGADKTRFIGFY